tara:strand:- start:10781 stop:11788 length:1008 start_codon:yes stop_codon:yes gene_type:complete
MPDNKIRVNQIYKPELSGYILDVGQSGPSGTDGQIQFASGHAGQNYFKGAYGLFYDHTGDQLSIGEGLIPQHKLHVSGHVSAQDVIVNGTGVFTASGSTSINNYIYVDTTNDNLIVRKANNTNNCFIFDGDVGNYGVGFPESYVPAFDLDVSGNQGVRSVSSLSDSKGQIEHEAGGTNLVVYDLSGVAKGKVSSHEDSYMLGGGLSVGTGALASYSSTYKGLNVVGDNFVSGNVELHGTGYFKNDLNIGGNTVSSGNITDKGTLVVDGTSHHNSSLSVGGSGIVSGGLIAQSPHVPTSTGSHGVSGQIAFDTGYLYLCINTDHWTRVQLLTGAWT